MVDRVEKIDIPAAFLSSIQHVELRNLKSQLEEKTLENQTIYEYVKLFQNEIDKTSESEMSDEDLDSDIQALQDSYQILYKIYKATPRHCQEIEDVKLYNQHLYLTYFSRKQEYYRFEKQVDAILNDPKVKEKLAKLAEIKEDLELNQQALADLMAEETELTDKINQIEKEQQEALDKEQKELADAENAIKEIDKFLNDPIEDQLAAQNEELAKELKRLKRQLNIDDDDDSSFSSMSSHMLHVPIVEKVTMDLTTFFKNPNDFPFLASLLSPSNDGDNVKEKSHQKRPLDSSPKAGTSFDFAAKKARINIAPLKAHNMSSFNEYQRQLKKKQKTPESTPKSQNVAAFNEYQAKQNKKQKIPKSLPKEIEPRQLRSLGNKRKSAPPSVEEPLSNSDKQPSIKIIRVEIIESAPPLPVKEKSPEKIQEASDEVIPSSEPEKAAYQPRSLNNDFEVIGKPNTAPIPSPEDPRDPGKDGKESELIAEETTEKNQKNQKGVIVGIESNSDVGSMFENGELSRADSTTSFRTNDADQLFNNNVLNISASIDQDDDVFNTSLSCANDDFDVANQSNESAFFNDESPVKQKADESSIF